MLSPSSSLTDVPVTDESQPNHTEGLSTQDHPGRSPSAISVDKKTELQENIEDNWQDDPENPRNWPLVKKWTTAAIVSLYTFVPPLSSSIMAPGLPEVAEKYHITNATVLALTLSIFLISYGVAPLILAPLSEIYGRYVLNLGNFITIGFSIGCAFSPTTGSLLVFRFLSGFSGSASLACGGGVVSDLFSERDRAAAMALYTLGPLIGPVLGPIVGGFVTETVGVKWVFIIVAGLGGILSALGFPLVRETYAPLLRLRKAKMSANPEKAALGHPALITEHSSRLHYLWNYLSRPAILLFGSPVCFMLSLYMAFLYGIYYLMFTTFDTLFIDTYGFNTGTSGLTYIGLGFGFILATAFTAKWGNNIYLYLEKENGGKAEPEMRIPAVVLGSLFVPIGLFWYGWSAAAKIHWIMPIIGTGYLPTQLYLVDTFTFAASALSAASVFRSLFGCVFPLFGPPMFAALGIGGGNSLLGGLAIVLGIPFPVYLYYHGASIRAKSKLTR
ncbi:multidrug resistance protein 4 [Mycena galericulata]|nr:multidrug resistance protein 4 [Mycena galericulata]